MFVSLVKYFILCYNKPICKLWIISSYIFTQTFCRKLIKVFLELLYNNIIIKGLMCLTTEYNQHKRPQFDVTFNSIWSWAFHDMIDWTLVQCCEERWKHLISSRNWNIIDWKRVKIRLWSASACYIYQMEKVPRSQIHFSFVVNCDKISISLILKICEKIKK